MTVTLTTRTQLYAPNDQLVLDISDTAKTNLILRAETMVDSLVGYHQKRTQTQHTVFPRLQDADAQGNGSIPWQVTQATLLMAQYLHAQSSQDVQLEAGDSLALGDFRMTKGQTPTSLRKALQNSSTGREILALLSDFVSFTFKLS